MEVETGTESLHPEVRRRDGNNWTSQQAPAPWKAGGILLARSLREVRLYGDKQSGKLGRTGRPRGEPTYLLSPVLRGRCRRSHLYRDGWCFTSSLSSPARGPTTEATLPAATARRSAKGVWIVEFDWPTPGRRWGDRT